MPSKSRRHIMHWYNLGQRRCPCCGVQLVYQPGQPNSATLEHLVPKSFGGTYDLENGLMVCYRCNNQRGSRCWIRWMNKKNPPKKEWLIRKYLLAVLTIYQKNPGVNVRKKVILKAMQIVELST